MNAPLFWFLLGFVVGAGVILMALLMALADNPRPRRGNRLDD